MDQTIAQQADKTIEAAGGHDGLTYRFLVQAIFAVSLWWVAPYPVRPLLWLNMDADFNDDFTLLDLRPGDIMWKGAFAFHSALALRLTPWIITVPTPTGLLGGHIWPETWSPYHFWDPEDHSPLTFTLLFSCGSHIFYTTTISGGSLSYTPIVQFGIRPVRLFGLV